MNFSMSHEEANLALQALSELPYKTVFLLINKMQQEAHAQMIAPATTPPPPRAAIRKPTKKA